MSVIHAEHMFRSCETKPAKSIIEHVLPIGDGEVKFDLRQVSAFVRGEILFMEIDNPDMVAAAIFRDWFELKSENTNG